MLIGSVGIDSTQPRIFDRTSLLRWIKVWMPRVFDSASMPLPFDSDQFLALFAAYNAAIWPAQLLAYLLGLLALAAFLLRAPLRERVILTLLAIMWAWNGIAYHLVFFTSINAAAPAFAILFALQAGLLAFRALKPGTISFAAHADWRGIAALMLVAYSMVGYEALSVMAGHGLMNGPLVGVAPCPTTIFTIALLVLGRGRSLRLLAVIPLIWAAIGTNAALLLGIPEDIGLAIAGAALVAALGIDALNHWKGGESELTRQPQQSR